MNFIIQKLKNKHIFLKKLRYWAKLNSLILREREETITKYFAPVPAVSWSMYSIVLWRFKYSVPRLRMCPISSQETFWLYKLMHFQNDLSCEICLNFLLTWPHLSRSLIFKCENMFMKISFGRDSMVKVESFGFLSFTLQILRRFGLSILQVTVISKNFSLSNSWNIDKRMKISSYKKQSAE